MTALTCPQCNTPYRPGAKFCVVCGKPLIQAQSVVPPPSPPLPMPPPPIPAAAQAVRPVSPPQVCPACGNNLPGGAKFCTHCGAALQPGVQPVRQVSVPPAPPPPVLPSPPTTAAKYRKLLPFAIGIFACCLLVAAGTIVYVVFPDLFNSKPTAIAEEEAETDPPTRTPRSPTITATFTETPAVTFTPTIMPTFTPTIRPPGEPFVGELAPDFTLMDAVSGEFLTLSQFTGYPVMINFWATWCGYCEDEMPYMQAAYEERQSLGLVILAIDVEETRAEVIAYGEDHYLTFNLLLDKDGDITALYTVSGFPTSFFVNPDGTIEYIQVGSLTQSELNQHLDDIMTGP